MTPQEIIRDCEWRMNVAFLLALACGGALAVMVIGALLPR